VKTNPIISNFFCKSHFKELKVLFILEFLILIIGTMLINTPSMRLFIESQNIKIFNIFAFLFTLFVYSLSCLVDPKKYFNLATMISTGIFFYGCFWFMFEIFTI
jgi:hypothetical protein